VIGTLVVDGWVVYCYILYSEVRADRAAPPPPSPLLVVSNVTAHPSTASVPASLILFDVAL